jgi:hypothetical protein
MVDGSEIEYKPAGHEQDKLMTRFVLGALTLTTIETLGAPVLPFAHSIHLPYTY